MNNKKELELYIHIPFCVSKCKYCDFISAPATEEAKDAYMEALCKEIIGRSTAYSEYQIVTVFIGGGTPTAVNPMWISKILGLVRQEYNLDENAEVTMEMNPGTVTEQSLEIYKTSGVNRLSIGLQSANNQELKLLGRIHTYEQFLESYVLARKVGFENINVDIMSALPEQSVESYLYTLEKITNLIPPPEHISAYSLIVEEGTPFYEANTSGSLHLPTEDEERKMYELTGSHLKQKGYGRYEISNYAKKGRECKHNVGYWLRREYLGLGIGAASLVDNKRFSNVTDIEEYMKEPCKKYGEIHTLTVEEQIEETMFLGLRMIGGVEEEAFEKQFGIELVKLYDEVLNKHFENGLLQRECREGKMYICLTPKGLDVSNYVMADFLEPVLF